MSDIRVQRVFMVLLLAGLLVLPAAAASTQVHVVKYASDGTTILGEQTLTYQQMRDTLPVMGDGVTHYYHQGPVFVDNPDEATEQALRWNPEEDTNVDTKDMGAVMGTNVRDLCDLVGGMSPGDTVVLKASDGWNMDFAYKNIYEYSSREGPMVLAWYTDFNTADSNPGVYPDTGYSDGMRMVWMADDGVNPWAIHAFGNYDWHEAAAPEYWYYYMSGGEYYPTTTGLSGKYISEIKIISSSGPVGPVAAFTSDKTSGIFPLTVQFTDQSIGTPTAWAWDFTNDGIIDSTEKNPSYTYTAAGMYTVRLTVTGAGGSDEEVKTNYITVNAPPVTPVAAFISNVQSGAAPLTVQFTDQSIGTPTAWAWDFNNDGTVDSTAQSPSYTYTSAGTYTVSLVATNTAGSDDEIKMNYITVSPPAPWTLTLVGASSYTMPSTEFEALAAAYPVSWTQSSTSTWSGVALWRLVAIVDDSDPAAFNDDLAASGYNVRITAVDGFQKTFASATIARNDGRILADKKNSLDLPVSQYPLKFVGAGLTAGQMVNRVVTITAMVPPPTAAFTSDVQTGAAPLTVQFTDQSTGSPMSWAWDFNSDGTVDSTEQSPSHVYDTPGTYSVKLTAANAAGSDDEVKTDYITVLPSLVWGPYLTGASATGMTVNGKTDVPTVMTVEYATDEYFLSNSAYDQTATDEMSTELHHISLAGLETDTLYHYRVTYGEQQTGDLHFRTFPESGPFTFAMYSDTQDQLPTYSQLERHKLVADRIAEEPEVLFVLNSGDLVNEAANVDDWDRYFEAGRTMMAGTPVFPARGNHDDNGPDYDAAYGVPDYYSFDCGDGHFTVLDSNSWAWPFDAQNAWMAEDLQTEKPFKFVSFHYPPYSSDSKHFGGWQDIRDMWAEDFYDSNVLAVFNGHVHAYERFLMDDVNYLVSGTGGGPAYTLATPHAEGSQNSLEYALAYTKVTVDPVARTSTAEVIRVADVSSDLQSVTTTYPPGTIFETVVMPLIEPPVADFTAEPLSGVMTVTVQFTDATASTVPCTYLWDFGDGSTSTEQNPLHTYTTPGTYTISLTATNRAGSHTETMTGLITVKTLTEGIQDTIASIEGMGLDHGIENSLTVKLDNAIKSLEKGNPTPAKNQLEACLHEIAAKTGKKIPEEQAAILVEQIQEIIQLL